MCGELQLSFCQSVQQRSVEVQGGGRCEELVFKINTRIAPPHFSESHSDCWSMADGCELFMSSFLGREWPCVDFIPEIIQHQKGGGGEMIERAESTISALQKMVECKQLMPDKTVVIFFSIVIEGALWHHYTGLKFLLLQLWESQFCFSSSILQPCLVLAFS